MRELLTQLSLKPSDVEARQVGVSQALVTALLSGQTVAAPLAPPNSFQVEAQGYVERLERRDEGGGSKGGGDDRPPGGEGR